MPQGSCLGPLLFLIYVNDLPLAVQGSTVSMYADETSLCHQALSMTQLNGAINNDLKRLDTWLQGNKLSLNVAKTHSMLITTKQKRNVLKSSNQNLELNIRSNELDVVQKTKYLGVQIDCSLDWKEQIKAVTAKVSRAIGFLKHATKFLPRVTLENLYIGIVEPHLRYCCSIWGCCGSSEINQLQKLQNRAARIVTNSSFDTPSRPLIERLGWGTIQQLISNESKTMVFKSFKPDLNIGSEEITMVNNTKYLGLQVDDQLKWSTHLSNTIKKVSRGIGMLKFSKRYLPKESLIMLYRSLIEPYFRYCCPVWGSCGASALDKLQKLQNRPARIVTNSPYDASALPLIGSLGWLTIRELIDFETSKMVYKSLNALAPDYLRNLFQKVSEATNRQLRNSKTDLRLPLLRTSTGQKSFAYRGAKVWSDLDSVVKASASFSSFRRNYETKL